MSIYTIRIRNQSLGGDIMPLKDWKWYTIWNKDDKHWDIEIFTFDADMIPFTECIDEVLDYYEAHKAELGEH